MMIAQRRIAAQHRHGELQFIADPQAGRLQRRSEHPVQHGRFQLRLLPHHGEAGFRQHVDHFAIPDDAQMMDGDRTRLRIPAGGDIARRQGVRGQQLDPIGGIDLVPARRQPGLHVGIDDPRRSARGRRRIGRRRGRQHPGRNLAILHLVSRKDRRRAHQRDRRQPPENHAPHIPRLHAAPWRRGESPPHPCR